MRNWFCHQSADCRARSSMLSTGPPAGPRLFAECFAEHVFVETDIECLALPKRWRAEVARWTEHQFRQRVVVEVVFLQVDGRDFLAFADDQLADCLE